MNKNIILKALQTELETVKADAIAHEQNVYEPAVASLTDKIKKWFAEHITPSIHSIEIHSDSIVIKPTDTTAYGSDITINYRSSWRKENGYIETSAYRPDLNSKEDNTNTIQYYAVMAGVAIAFDSICKQYITKWMPVFDKLKTAKDEKYSSIYNIEREIRNCENEIAAIEMEAYNKAGFECTLKPYVSYDSNYDNNETVYTKKLNDHSIRANYGRGRWDYYSIHSFKVVSFPKAKHAKVVLEFKGTREDEKTRTAELSKQRYADFVREVYNWQTKGAADREADMEERIARWNKTEVA